MKFKRNDRVIVSRFGIVRLFLAPGTTGVVRSFGHHQGTVRIQRDDRSSVVTYHEDFWDLLNKPLQREPRNGAEWQQAVDCAAALRTLHDCARYGFISGGPIIDVVRCDEMLDRGRERGIVPSRPVVELAAEAVAEYKQTQSH